MDDPHFFTLRKNVFFVQGALRAALYDPVQSRDVYSIDPVSAHCLEGILSGSRVRSIAAKLSDTDQFMDWLYSLEKKGLGSFSASPGSFPRLPPKPEQQLEFLWFELTEGCNLQCTHCCTESSPQKIKQEKETQTQYRRSLPVLQTSRPSPLMEHEDWLRVVDEAATIPLKRLQLIGGEPFLYPRILDLLEYAQAKGIRRREVFTNGTYIDEEKATRLRDLDAQVAISLYGPNSDVHETITQQKRSFRRTTEAIRLLRDRGVPVRVAVIAMRSNEEVIEETLRFVREELGVENISYDLVRPAGRGCNDDLVPQRLYQQLRTAPRFPKIDYKTFVQRIYGHSCLQGELYIAADGKVYPCVMDKLHPLGSLKHASLSELLKSDGVHRFWDMTKDQIEECRECEYRYACFDCRPKAMAGDPSQLLAKPRECLYEPRTGTWHDPKSEFSQRQRTG